jgi:hypothetical protein
MISLDSITICNFLSVGAIAQTVVLTDAPLTLVLGCNMDAGGENHRNGAGKAQPLSAKIKTPIGWTTMGELKVNDIVSTPDGKTALVLNLYPQGEKDIYRVTFADGRSTECCEDHLWRAWMRKCDWGWHTVSLKEIIDHKNKTSMLGGRVYIPLMDTPQISDSILPIDPRLLGILLGDGNLTSATPGFSSADNEIIDYASLCLPAEYCVSRVGTSKYDYRITRSSEPCSGDYKRRRHQVTHLLGKPLQDMGLRGLKSHEKFIPQCYKDGSFRQRIQLIQGLIDTDGYVSRHGDISFCSTSKQLALDVQEIIWSIGGVARIKEKQSFYIYNGDRREGRVAYNVLIRYKSPRDLVALTRKRERISENYQYAKSLRLEIKSIEYIGKKSAQCILIDHPSHLYITDNFIVTHNTTLLQAICYALYGEPLTKIKVDNLVNSINEQAMLVSIAFTRDGVPYRIERGRKPNLLRFLVGSERKDFAKGKNEQTQIEIERVIGMTHTMFVHVVALNTFTLPFLKMRPGEQREVIEELMGITLISQLAEQLKIKMDINKEALRDEEATIKATVDANARITQAIEQAQQQANTWLVGQDALLTEIGDRATKMLEIDIATELAVFDRIDVWNTQQQSYQAQSVTVRGSIASMQHDLSRLHIDLARYDAEANDGNSAEIERMHSEVSRLRELAGQSVTPQVDRLLTQADRRRQTATIQRRRCDDLWQEVNAITAQDSHQCSMCGQGLAGTDHLAEVLAAIEQKKRTLAAQIERTLTEIDQCEADSVADEVEVATLRKDHAAQCILLQEQATSLFSRIILTEQNNTDHRQVAADQAAQMRTQITSRQRDLDAHHRNLDTLTKGLADFGDCPVSPWDSRDALYALRQEREKLFARLDVELSKTNPLQGKIDGLTSTLLAINYDHLNDLTMQFKHEQFLYKLLTSKDSFIRKRIIDQNLSYLNHCLNKYLARLGLPHEVAFMPDLSVEISLLGRNFDFEQLSRGEMNRLILATSWSFRDLWENLNHSINLIFMDECLDSGTDQAGIEAAIDVLSVMAAERHKNIFLISHRETLRNRIDHVLVARKVDQFTSFGAET